MTGAGEAEPVDGVGRGEGADGSRTEPGRVGRAAVTAAALAALAEGGVLYLPTAALLSGWAPSVTTPPGALLVYVAAFAGGTALATRARHQPWMPTAAVAIAAAFGLGLARWWGLSGLGGLGLAISVALAAAVRTVAFALRDWREPIRASFGWGACALLVEIVFSMRVDPEWHGPLLVLIPVFFACSLASRATTVWSADAALADEAQAGTWRRRAFAGATGLALLSLAALASSGSGSVLERVGRALTTVTATVLEVLAFVFAIVAAPLFWLATKVGFDVGSLREVIDRLRRAFGRARRGVVDTPVVTNSGIQRLLGALLLAGILAALVWAIRYQRRRLRERAEDWVAPPEPEARTVPVRRPILERFAAWRRRELPEDTVRRWYAEVLVALEAAGVSKPPSATPGEFVPAVVSSYPANAGSFATLTRAYENVRYGLIQIDRAAIQDLQPHRDALLETFRSAGPDRPGPPPTAE